MRVSIFRLSILKDWLSGSDCINIHTKFVLSTLTKVGLVLTALDLYTSWPRLDQEVSYQLLQWIPWERDELFNDQSAEVYTDIGANPVWCLQEVPLPPSELALGGGVATFRARP